MKDSIETIIIRGISIVSKFLLLGFLARVLSLEDYGGYQLIAYFSLIFIAVFGLEYYNISNRKLAQNLETHKTIQDHFSFQLSTLPFLILVLVVIMVLILPSEIISFKNIIMLLFITLCDYYYQEIYRYLMILKKYRKGNLQLIYKSILFLVILFIYYFIFKEMNLQEVIYLMFVSYILLFFLALRSFHNNILSVGELEIVTIKYRKLKKILIRLIPFILMVIFLKGIEFSDKFILEKFMTLKEVGIYSFLFSISSLINVFVVSGFYIIFLPRLIDLFSNDIKLFQREFFKFSGLVILSSIILSIIIIITSPIIFYLINKIEFLEYKNLLMLLLVGFIFNNFSLIPHLFLYINHNENKIMHVTGFSFLCNFILNIYLIKSFGLIGAAYSFIITYGIFFILKTIIALNQWKKIKEF